MIGFGNFGLIFLIVIFLGDLIRLKLMIVFLVWGLFG